MEKLEQLYEGKAKKVFKTDDPELYIVDYKDDATALNGLKKGTIHNKGIINNLSLIHIFRDYSPDPKHHRVDDSPYGGGKGMVMQPEPIYRCYLDVVRQAQSVPHVIYLSPQGKTLNQQKALALREVSHLFLLCGHYEGVDERIIERIVDEEISIGDYVLTGGELGALVLIDSVVRLLSLIHI